MLNQTITCVRQQHLFEEIEQLNRKVVDLEKKVQSQSINFVIDSNEAAKATLKFMKPLHKVGGDESEKPKEGT